MEFSPAYSANPAPPRRNNMCTVIVLVRPGHEWPLLLAANRDEMQDRQWDPPGEWWHGVVGGRDRSGGGTWLGVNRHGVVAAVLNRSGSLGPAPGKRSRGSLPLLALEHATATKAAEAILALEAHAYRSFNMVLADRTEAIFVRGLGAGRPHGEVLAEGLHMVTARDPDDADSKRVARHLPRLRAAGTPKPPDGWAAWQAILADHSGPVESQINVLPHAGFATVCSSMIALAADRGGVWRFAPGPPDRTPFESVTMP